MAHLFKKDDPELDAIAVRNFRNYLRIRSVHPNVNYDECVDFITGLASNLGLQSRVVRPLKNKPIVIVTWEGLDASLPTLLLNSHMDVVPVEAEAWSFPPFAGQEYDGCIYGRGAQDMKCIGIQYLEAIRRLQRVGVRLLRTVHCTFVPDEEIGGATGMKQFVRTQEFCDLNVGVALDEGLPSSNDTFFVFNAERCMWHVIFHCPGQPGHGSLLLEDTAIEKVHNLLTKILDHRANQIKLLESNPRLTLGDVMTVNVSMINGGQQANVLPSEMTITMDCRIPVTTDLEQWSAQIDTWCAEAGSGVHTTQTHFEHAPPTPLTDDNPYWKSFQQVAHDMGLQIETRVFPAATDARFLRQLRIPAFGFSPICNHPVLLHGHDEFLTRAMFIRGIHIYARLIAALGDSPTTSS